MIAADALDFWSDVGTSSGAEHVGTVAVRLGVAIALGLAIAWVRSLNGRGTTRARLPLHFALMLLPVLVAMTMLIIADSIARAFGLVGALSIVRFRTLVEDTRDTVFIVFAVVTGMAAGAGNLAVCAVGVPLVAVVAHLISRYEKRGASVARTMILEVRVGLGHDADALVREALSLRGVAARLIGVATARQGAASDSQYEIAVPIEDARRIAVDLSARDGVQSVELREP